MYIYIYIFLYLFIYVCIYIYIYVCVCVLWTEVLLPSYDGELGEDVVLRLLLLQLRLPCVVQPLQRSVAEANVLKSADECGLVSCVPSLLPPLIFFILAAAGLLTSSPLCPLGVCALSHGAKGAER